MHMTSEIASLPWGHPWSTLLPLALCLGRLPCTDCILPLPHPVISSRSTSRSSGGGQFPSSVFSSQRPKQQSCWPDPLHPSGNRALLFGVCLCSQTDSAMLTSEVSLLCSCHTCIIIIFDVDRSYSLYLICYNMAPVLCLGVLATRHVGPLLPNHGWNSHLLCWKVKFQTLDCQGSPSIPL